MAGPFRLPAAAASLTVRVAGRTPGKRRVTPAAWRHPGLRPVKRLALILASLGAATVSWLIFVHYADEVRLAPGRQSLELTWEDADPESTALVVRLLRDNQLDGRLALALIRETQPTKAGLQELSPALHEGKVPPVLIPAAQTLRDALERGDAHVYTVWIQAADLTVRGSVVLSLDGYSLGSFSVCENPYPLSLVLKTRCPARLRIRASNAVSQVVALRGETATAEAVTRKLRPGRSDEWVLTAVR